MKVVSQKQIDEARGRLTLWRRGPNSAARISEVLETLSDASDELQATNNELCRQNEGIATSWARFEAKQERYRQFFEFSPDAYLITDRLGVIEKANLAAGLMFCTLRRLLVGIPLTTYVAKQERKAFLEQLVRINKVMLLENWEISLESNGNGSFPVRINASVIRGADGNPSGIRWVIRDIAAAKAKDQEIQALKSEIEALRNIIRKRG